jgi:hypothetical protein
MVPRSHLYMLIFPFWVDIKNPCYNSLTDVLHHIYITLADVLSHR